VGNATIQVQKTESSFGIDRLTTEEGRRSATVKCFKWTSQRSRTGQLGIAIWQKQQKVSFFFLKKMQTIW